MSWKTGVKRSGHVIWAMVTALSACGAIYGAIAFYDQYRVQESSIGQAVHIANNNTTSANMYLFGVVACIGAVGLLIWNTVYHWKAAERLSNDQTT
jgi:hypothetical protein